MNNSWNILVCDLVVPPGDIEREVFGSSAVIWTPQAMKPTDISEEQWHNCHALIAYDRLRYDEQLISKLTSCKVIVRAGIGHDNIDKEAAKKHGITVCNTPDYCTTEVADHTMALLLSIVRGVFQHAKQVEQKTWQKDIPGSFRLEGKTFGCIGFGRIGRATALRAKAFGMKVIYFDPFASITNIEEGIERVTTLDEIARLSDIISLHTPLTKETQNIVGEEFLKKVKPGIVLLNTARGGLIDIHALYDAMKNGPVAACGLDALPIERSDSSQQLIVDYEQEAEWLKWRLVITPHVAYYSKEAMAELRRKSAAEAKRVLQGERPLNQVG